MVSSRRRGGRDLRSTTIIARGKLRLMAQRGEEIPEGRGRGVVPWSDRGNHRDLKSMVVETCSTNVTN